jgi:hypothetical protein
MQWTKLMSILLHISHCIILNKYRVMLFKLVPLRIFKIMNVKIAYSRLYGLWFMPLHVSLKKYGHYTQHTQHSRTKMIPRFTLSIHHFLSLPEAKDALIRMAVLSSCATFLFSKSRKNTLKNGDEQNETTKINFLNGCLLINQCLYYNHQNSSRRAGRKRAL